MVKHPTYTWQMHWARSPETSCNKLRATNHGDENPCQNHALGELQSLPLPPFPIGPGCRQTSVQWPAEMHELANA
eukprot:11114119-Lingulodinium_polyedra.AAC.1